MKLPKLFRRWRRALRLPTILIQRRTWGFSAGPDIMAFFPQYRITLGIGRRAHPCPGELRYRRHMEVVLRAPAQVDYIRVE